jgi:hypothetical protein
MTAFLRHGKLQLAIIIYHVYVSVFKNKKIDTENLKYKKLILFHTWKYEL